MESGWLSVVFSTWDDTKEIWDMVTGCSSGGSQHNKEDKINTVWNLVPRNCFGKQVTWLFKETDAPSGPEGVLFYSFGLIFYFLICIRFLVKLFFKDLISCQGPYVQFKNMLSNFFCGWWSLAVISWNFLPTLLLLYSELAIQNWARSRYAYFFKVGT